MPKVQVIPDKECVDKLTFEKYLRDFEELGNFIVGLGLKKSSQNPPQYANYLSYDLPPSLGLPPTLKVEIVPEAAKESKDAFSKFIAPFILTSELVDRQIIALNKMEVEIVLLRTVTAVIPPLQGTILKGDGTWPWTAVVEGDDIVVYGAITTAFGGSDDTQDSGQTASGYPTFGHPELLGCALPMDGYAKTAKEKAALDGSPIPKMPFGIKKDGTPNPDGAQVKIRDPKTGREIIVPVIDLGPAKKTGHALDLTVAAATVFKPGATANNFRMLLDYRIVGGAKYLSEAVLKSAKSVGFAQRLAMSAVMEHQKFSPYKETVSPLKERIETYWGAVKNATFPGVDEAWSAVFVSWCVRNAGATMAEFPGSPQHSVFVKKAIAATAAGTGIFHGRPITEYAPKVGDIIQNNREGNKYTFDYARENGDYFSHTAVVVEKDTDENGPFVRTIGGNESNSIRKSRVAIDAHGKIVQRTVNPFICVLETRKA